MSAFVDDPALRDPIAEVAMCLNAANAALPEGLIDDPARMPFIRMQLQRALSALDRIAAQKPALRLVANSDDAAGSSCGVVA